MKNFAKSYLTGFRGNIQALPVGVCREMTGDPRSITVDADWYSAALDLGVRGRGTVLNTTAANRTIRATPASGGSSVYVAPIGAVVEWQSETRVSGYLSVTTTTDDAKTYSGFILASALNIAQEPKRELFNAGVTFDFSYGPGKQLNQIVGVYIDNSDVPTPVYLRCDDTGHIVSCSDYKSGHFTLLTSEQRFTLFTENIIPAYASAAKTRLIFYNVAIPNAAEEQFNEVLPLQRVSGLAQYRSQALGDKVLTAQVNVFNYFPPAGQVKPVISNTVMRAGKALTNIAVTGVYVDINRAAAQNAPNGMGAINIAVMQGPLGSDPIFQTIAYLSSSPPSPWVVGLSNLNLLLDGSLDTRVVAQMVGNSGAQGTGTYADVTFIASLIYAELELPLLS